MNEELRTTVPEPYRSNVGFGEVVVFSFREFGSPHLLMTDLSVAIEARHSPAVFDSLRHRVLIAGSEFARRYLDPVNARIFIVEDYTTRMRVDPGSPKTPALKQSEPKAFGFAGLVHIDERSAEICWALPGCYRNGGGPEPEIVGQVIEWGHRCGLELIRGEVYSNSIERLDVLQKAEMRVMGTRPRTVWRDEEWLDSFFLESWRGGLSAVQRQIQTAHYHSEGVLVTDKGELDRLAADYREYRAKPTKEE